MAIKIPSLESTAFIKLQLVVPDGCYGECVPREALHHMILKLAIITRFSGAKNEQLKPSSLSNTNRLQGFYLLFWDDSIGSQNSHLATRQERKIVSQLQPSVNKQNVGEG